MKAKELFENAKKLLELELPTTTYNMLCGVKDYVCSIIVAKDKVSVIIKDDETKGCEALSFDHDAEVVFSGNEDGQHLIIYDKNDRIYCFSMIESTVRLLDPDDIVETVRKNTP